ncbi:MAG: SSU ribosomal protein S17p (S11e) [uncultured Thiotrichaceae bacterium]|uniref:Small ribosomal subunit protein uS17 n=1 Tax=uncultured Thiotrichaceae bacterium TaxID=298394 RepID=A0A6S6SF26_9GAMM|nr:MAG: SSU ribosomal protein S17p (S11e) [uncultured Thiotrichaceae bacterium]
MTENTSSESKIERSLQGVVSSDKMDKTVVVKIERKVKHALYGKYIRRSTTFHVHDENNECKVGDTVMFKECRPYSKKKHWTLLEVVEKTAS